jgi:hypothetical protein
MKLQAKSDIVLREEDGDAFLFDPDTGRVSVINGTGVIVWKELSSGKDQEGIVKTLKKEFSEVDEKKLKTDCAAFLRNLEKSGYIQ